MEVTKREKLTFGVKLGYGAAEGGLTSTFNLVYFFLLFFLTDIVGINPALAGTVLMVATLFDAITDPAIGIFSDNLKWKWGRRRPLILIAALPFGLTTWLMFTDFQLGSGSLIYFIVISALMFFFLTLISVPYQALGAEITRDYNERTSLGSFRSGWSVLLTLFSLSVPLILVEYFAEEYGSARLGWSVAGAVFAVIASLLVLVTWRTTRGHEKPLTSEKTGFKLKDVFSVINRLIARQ
jgi:GPH family glycoside/pentoside/hexuronide:cation symporter